ncbi:hypothetical protein INT47_002685 [Mucor saturninus]|uniref:DNA 3'-5' helicase n=1 Tax=Mucor saturninus TaxID=64648 RepID=A0A8H7QP56_9FUNG|nr:hypothetical protein INT47_002685 [Mucor saturninus]
MSNEKEKFQTALESLNPTQRDSVLSDADSLQILAGPGSGKTRVLTYRVAYLVIEKGIEPNQIIVVTFTNKAANEMKTRLFKLIGVNKTNRLLIGTFHAICSKLLHHYGQYAGIDPSFSICDPDQSKTIIKTIQEDKNINIDEFTRKTLTPGALLGIISKAKSKGEDEHMYKELYGKEYKTRYIAVVFMAYEEELKRQNMLDYDNLILKCCALLKRKKNVLSNIKSILVDEYQDTNIVQYDLIKLMMKQVNKKSVTIVGDPDQSIFGWRSAEPKNFGKMEEDFDGTRSIKMEQNYRSTGKVIKSALHVIKQDEQRIDKLLYTNNPEGIPISLITTQDPKSQADFVAAEIKKAIVGGDRFFDRVEVKDMTSYLSFAYNPKNISAFTRIINVPKRGIGEVWLKRILKFDMDNNGTLLDSLREIGHGGCDIKVPPQMVGKIRQFVMICTHIRDMIENKKEVTDILSYIYEATEYEKYLKDHYFQDYESRWQNLGELLSIAKKTTEDAASHNDHYEEDTENTTAVKPVDETMQNGYGFVKLIQFCNL